MKKRQENMKKKKKDMKQMKARTDHRNKKKLRKGTEEKMVKT